MMTLSCALLVTALGSTSSAPLEVDPARDVGIVEKLGTRVPLDLTFTDAQGNATRLNDFTSDARPILLTLGYQRCPMLCNLLLSGLVRALHQTKLVAGKDYRLVSLSIDPSETLAAAAERQHGSLRSLDQGSDPSLWPFLVGSQANIRAVADAVGFQYSYDERSRLFAHDAAAFVLTPDGRVSRYVYGVEPDPRQLELSLVEASGGRVGPSFDRFLLACYRWDPSAHRYSFYIRRSVQAGGLAVFLALAFTLGSLWRRELRRAV